MGSTGSKQNQCFEAIDYARLMDLRVDYAFKLLFGSGEPLFLISLLNSIFASKRIERVIDSITIENPNLGRRSKSDKMSILDLRAQLDDGTAILIEMHLYDLFDLKYKTIRSWARIYGEELSGGEKYSAQPPVICVAFINGQIVDSENRKIHSCFKIMDIDDGTLLSDAMELHYIDMNEYVVAVNETRAIGNGEAHEAMLAKWLAVIAEKDIVDKAIIKSICEEQEEIGMAVSALVRLSEDKQKRQEYLKRQDEIMLYNKKLNELKQAVEQGQHELKQEKKKAEQEKKKAEREKKKTELEKKKAEREKKKAELEKKKAELEKKKAEREKLRAEAAEAEIRKLRARLVELETQKKS